MRVPSNKVSIVILLAVLVVVGTVSISMSQANREGNDLDSIESRNLEIGVKLADTLDVDTDKDGLLDWEESLWGTDPNLKDTDGDGTTDGAEVEANRNPTDGSAEDANVDVNTKILERLEGQSFDENTLTNRLLTDFTNDYFRLKGQGTLDDEAKSQLLTDAVGGVTAELTLTDVYTANMIKTFNTGLDAEEDSQRILTYANEFRGVQKEFASVMNANYFEEDGQKLFNLTNSASLQLANIETPQRVLQDHLKLANGYYNLAEVSKSLADSGDDPVAALISMQLIVKVNENLVDANGNVAVFLKESGIILENGELKYIYNE